MRRVLSIILATLLIVLSGLVHGYRTDRWAVAEDIGRSLVVLQHVPKNFGEWEGQTSELPNNQLEVAEINGYFSCEYVNRKNGNVISVLVVGGRSGPIAVHPPDICYQGAGFGLARPPETRRIDIPGTELSPEVSMALFQKPNAGVPQTLQVFWSWTADGKWQVPAIPRVTFARSHILYKMYVIRELPSKVDSTVDDPSVEFVREFLPELNRVLFAADSREHSNK